MLVPLGIEAVPRALERDYIAFAVRDKASGIDLGRFPGIWSPSPHRHGFSGLFSVLCVIDAHGGAIKLRSLPGEGTCVQFFLPCEAEGVPR